MMKYSNQIIDKILKKHGNKIERISNYHGILKHMTFKCLQNPTHGTWTTTASNVIHDKSGYPKCAKVMQAKREKEKGKVRFLRVCQEKHYQPLSHYISACHSIIITCSNSNHPAFKSTPNNIIFRKINCPQCLKQYRIHDNNWV